MLRKLGAIVLGSIAGYLIVMAIEMLNLVLFKPPAGMNFSDSAALKSWIESLPQTAFILILVAWLVGAVVGVWIATRVGRSPVPGIVVGLLLLGATVSNFFRFPHPVWVMVAAVVGLLLIIWTVTRGARLPAATSAG